MPSIQLRGRMRPKSKSLLEIWAIATQGRFYLICLYVKVCGPKAQQATSYGTAVNVTFLNNLNQVIFQCSTNFSILFLHPSNLYRMPRKHIHLVESNDVILRNSSHQSTAVMKLQLDIDSAADVGRPPPSYSMHEWPFCIFHSNDKIQDTLKAL